MALPRVADSLAGRVEVLSLLPLAGCELAGQPSAWIDALFAALAGEALERRVLSGGYPEALQRSSESRRCAASSAIPPSWVPASASMARR